MTACFPGRLENVGCRGQSSSDSTSPLCSSRARRHPKPRSAGVVRALTERGDERELFGARR